MTSSRCPNSVFSVRKNLRLAGVLKNRSRTSTEVPTGWAAGCTWASISRPAVDTCQALSCCAVFEVSVRRATELILAKASPRKPKLLTASKSSKLLILLVAWRLRDKARSSFSIPHPLSRIRINLTPPCSTSTLIVSAPASRLFSNNSFTTDAGRSTTSPAAI